jgi:hypothetical protein
MASEHSPTAAAAAMATAYDLAGASWPGPGTERQMMHGRAPFGDRAGHLAGRSAHFGP